MTVAQMEQDSKQDGSERRAFLSTATKFATVLGLIGLTAGGSDEAMAASQVSARKQLLNDAIRSGNVDQALAKHGKNAKLSPKEMSALKSLTKKDLQQLRSLQRKLKPLGTKMGDNVGGTFVGPVPAGLGVAGPRNDGREGLLHERAS